MSRRDREGCEYDAYLPDRLVGWDLAIPAEVAIDKIPDSVPGCMDIKDDLPKDPEVPGPAVITRSIVVLGLIRGEGSPGFVLYSYLDEPDRRYRVLDYEFDRLCRCNTFARIRAGDVVDIEVKKLR